MSIDRTWMSITGMNGRRKPEYAAGVSDFLEFAFSGKEENTEMRCPCVKCNLTYYQGRDKMWEHLMGFGIMTEYNPWVHHGESAVESDNNIESGDDYGCSSGDDMSSMLFDATNTRRDRTQGAMDSNTNIGFESTASNDDFPKEFYKLMEDMDAELYPGCKTFKKLEFIIMLLHVKVSNKWSEKSFQILLEMLHKAFNYAEGFPNSSYEAKKYTRALGLDYVKIDACVNHCILYRKEYSEAMECPKCGVSRWKEKVVQGGDVDTDKEVYHKDSRVPQLVLRHFPIIPRLQRMFMSSKLSKNMRWHKEERPDDGVLRHPADGKAWKWVDELYPNFAGDPRNVRLALSTDGFNPGSNFSYQYSIWPVLLVPYNLPPWICMKSTYLMLALLIPGPKSPGNDIDVFLEPLIDELKELWEVGVKTYDAYKKEVFDMHGVLMWTFQDFPAYANLSGWSTKGFLACPNCHKNTSSQRLYHSRKWCYMGHRRFLEPDHKWRLNRSAFGGKTERGPPPVPLTGHEALEQLMGCQNVEFGKDKRKRKKGERYIVQQWKKRSIFFELPYWRHLLIRHTLDVMHVEKNVCDNILGTLLEIPGKNKDSLNARLDLVEMNMHDKLRVQQVGDKYQIPKAAYNLTLAERRKVVTFLSQLVVPDGYSSNIRRCVTLDDGKIKGMKSHDCHVFMQDLLIPAFRGVLDDKVLEPLAELSLFFKQLCSKTLRVEVLEQMEKDIALTLCKLERIFIPSFFDVMVHLVVHLATEAKLCGPIPFHWMYKSERKMGRYKVDIRNRAHPEACIAEACIAEACIAEECIEFCSRYMSKTQTQFNKSDRNDDVDEDHQHMLSIFSKKGKPLGKANFRDMTYNERQQAQLYVLRNCEEAQPFVNDYENLAVRQKESLCDWFNTTITNLWRNADERVSEELFCLAQGPLNTVISYQGYVINGFRFHTRKKQRKRKTQNSGVVVKGDMESGDVDFYGVLEEIILLEYNSLQDRTSPKLLLFKCKWFDAYNKVNGVKRDKFGITLVNVSKKLSVTEPFALASQVGQVFYVPSQSSPQWRIVIKTRPRNYFDFPNEEDNTEEIQTLWDTVEDDVPNVFGNEQGETNDDIVLVRDDVEPELVDANIVAQCVAEEATFDDDDGDNNEEEDEEFSEGGSSIGPLDKDLEEVEIEAESEDEEWG